MKTSELSSLLGEGWLVPLESRPASYPVIVPLEHPITHGGESLSELKIGDVRGIHVRQCPQDWSSNGAYLLMLGLLTGLPDSVIDQLEGNDLATALIRVREVCWPIFELPGVAAESKDPDVHREWPTLDAPLELELETPLRVGQDAFSTITFRSMTGRIIRRLPSGLRWKDHPRLIELLTGLDPKAVDQLSGVDLNRALAVAECFFAGSLVTRGAPGGPSPRPSPGPPAS